MPGRSYQQQKAQSGKRCFVFRLLSIAAAPAPVTIAAPTTMNAAPSSSTSNHFGALESPGRRNVRQWPVMRVCGSDSSQQGMKTLAVSAAIRSSTPTADSLTLRPPGALGTESAKRHRTSQRLVTKVTGTVALQSVHSALLPTDWHLGRPHAVRDTLPYPT